MKTSCTITTIPSPETFYCCDIIIYLNYCSSTQNENTISFGCEPFHLVYSFSFHFTTSVLFFFLPRYCFVSLNLLKHKRIESFIQLCWYSIISCPLFIVLKWYVVRFLCVFFLSALSLESRSNAAQALNCVFIYDTRVLLSALPMNNCYYYYIYSFESYR